MTKDQTLSWHDVVFAVQPLLHDDHCDIGSELIDQTNEWSATDDVVVHRFFTPHGEKAELCCVEGIWFYRGKGIPGTKDFANRENFYLSGQTCFEKLLTYKEHFAGEGTRKKQIDLNRLPDNIEEICAAVEAYRQKVALQEEAKRQEELRKQQIEEQKREEKRAYYREHPDLYRQIIENILLTYPNYETYLEGMRYFCRRNEYPKIFGVEPPRWFEEIDLDERVGVSIRNAVYKIACEIGLPLPENITIPERALRRNGTIR